jgi:hypothetical protein
MKTDSMVMRYCEKCKKNTLQIVEFPRWCKVRARCLEKIGNIRCGYVHEFILSHVGAYPFESMEPFTRLDLGIIVKEKE